MYREEKAHKKLGTLAGILITLALAASVMALIFVLAFIGYLVGLPWIQLFAFVIVIAAVILIIRRFLTDYIYIAGGGKILFGRRIGRREKELLTVPLRNIRRLGVFDEMRESAAGKKNYHFSFEKKSECWVADCGTFAVFFSPSDTLREKIAGE